MSQQTQSFVKSALKSHSLVGLGFGAILYLICFTGVLSIFYEEIERWIQPHADEHYLPTIAEIETTLNEVIQTPELTTEHMYVVFPNEALPRFKIANEREGWYLNRDGELDVSATEHISHLITGLHTHLTLPETIGLYLVSLMAVVLMGLIISGFCAHPNIFKDAFNLRWGRSRQLKEVDNHNRLSVWGSPFYLMMAITGAYFGFSGLLFGAYVWAFYPGTQDQLVEEVFGAEPVVQEQSATVNLTGTMDKVAEINPEGSPLFAIVHDAGTDHQFMEVFMQQPGRFIYSENYRFDSFGNYLGKAGYSDGNVAKQIAYSVYRIHFGHYGGIAIKLLYCLLGLALAYVCISGINIWLIKRRYQDWLNRAWPATIWGLPLAITLSAALQFLNWLPVTTGFWTIWLAVIITVTALKNRVTSNAHYCVVNGIGCILLVAVYSLILKPIWWGPGVINTVLLVLGIIAIAFGTAQLRRKIAFAAKSA